MCGCENRSLSSNRNSFASTPLGGSDSCLWIFPAFAICFSGSLERGWLSKITRLLFGADPAPRIVAIELGETGTVKVYRREKDGSTAVDVEPFHPFVWTDGDITDLGSRTRRNLPVT